MAAPEVGSMDELLTEFLTETVEAARALDERDEDVPGTVFRMTATIVATARFLDIPRLEEVARVAEALAGGLREGRVVSSPEAIALLLAAVRRIEEIAGSMMQAGSEPARQDGELVNRLANAAGYTGVSDQINPLESSLRPKMAQALPSESPTRLRLIVGGCSRKGARDETLPDRR